MRERTLLGGVVLLCLLFLAGCKTSAQTDAAFDADSISKAQKIVIYDAAGNEKAVLAEKADIETFIDAVNVGGWKFAELPEGLRSAGSFTLWQEETVTALLGEREAEVNEICTFRVYQNGDYLSIETALIDIPFSIPQEAAGAIREYLQ